MQGKFTQRQYGDGDKVLAESTGRFRLLRPVYFSWEIQAPDRQLIVANADYLWHYDMDLQTATRRPVVGGTSRPRPAGAGWRCPLCATSTTWNTSGRDSFTLQPLGAEHSFRRLGVTFAGDAISRMDIVDKLGQRVVVDFHEVDTTSPLTVAISEFTTRGRGDLFYYDE